MRLSNHSVVAGAEIFRFRDFSAREWVDEFPLTSCTGGGYGTSDNYGGFIDNAV